MTRKAAACFIFLFSFCLLTLLPPRAGADVDGIIKKVQPATVKITVFDRAGKPVATGSGFLFKSSGRIITNWHVLGNAAMAKARLNDGTECGIKAIVAEDRENDLVEAVIEIPSAGVRYLQPANTPSRQGDPVIVIGSPFGVEKAVSTGTFVGIQEVQKFGKCIVHSAHSFPGSSGSPLVNEQGDVIGIETAAVPGNPNINLAVPLERFASLSPNFRQLQALPAPEPAPVAAQSRGLTDVPRKESAAADSSDPSAMVRLALAHELGQGVSKNCSEALSLYERAASRGSVEAEFHIGRMYYDGKCSGQKLSESARYLQKAADKGFPEAQRFFGLLCYNGEGTARDKVRACMYLILSASQGNSEAQRLLRLVSSQMTREEFDSAQEKARGWRPVR